ncbi:MAG: hypothetical protein U0931_05390 [Vulcanimicrobiota bacterium]
MCSIAAGAVALGYDACMDKSSNATWIGLAVALPLLYLLSIGPVVFLTRKSGPPSELLIRAYTPIIWLHDHTFLEEPLEAYVEFWEHLSP